VGQLLRPWVVVQIDREVGRERELVGVVRGEGVSVRVFLVDYASDQKLGEISMWKGAYRAI
jgi:hypothetical protein